METNSFYRIHPRENLSGVGLNIHYICALFCVTIQITVVKMLYLFIFRILWHFQTVRRLDPDFLAVHCQEVGGKNYEDSMQHVNKFIK